MPHRAQTVIAGPPEQVDAVIAVVDASRTGSRGGSNVDVASHHPMMDPILPELRAALADLDTADADDPVHQHRRRHRARADVRRRLLGGQRAQPVRFSQAVATAAEHHATFIEISPHPLLTHAIGPGTWNRRDRAAVSK